MVIYILLIMLLGIGSAIASYRYIAKSNGKEVSTIEYGFWNSLFSALLLCVYMLVQLFFSESAAQMVENTDVAPILLFMFLGGATSIVSSVCELNALKIGTKSLTSAIVNTALALSTIFFVIFWDSVVTGFNVIGIVLMILAVVLIGFTKGEEGSANSKWFILCISALLFNTMSIILTTVPSQYNMQDAMGLRGVSIMGFMALLYYAIKRYKHIKTDTLAIKIAIVNSVISAMVQILTYPLLDALAKENMAYIFTPIKLVSQIIFFSLITAIKFKERLSKIQLTGMIMCVVGILLFLV